MWPIDSASSDPRWPRRDETMVGLLRRVWRARGAVWRHPVQIGTVVTAAAVLWFVATLVKPMAPIVTGWLPGLLTVILTVGVCLSTARRPGVPRAVAQFWSALALSGVFVGAGTVVRAVRGLDPGVPAQSVGVPDMLAYLAALVVIGVALFRLPLGIADAGQRWRFWLDLSTVMVSTALFFWYFSVRQTMANGDDERANITGVIAGALALVLVFAVVKVVLTGAATIHSGSLRMLGLGLLSGTIGSVPEPLLPLDGPTTAQLVVPLANLFGIAAAMRQHRTADLSGIAPARRERRFSLLPYSAVAASSGLLMYTAVAGGTADRLVVAGAVVCLVGLVISRQILAFKDNSRLVTQLDAGLEATRGAGATVPGADPQLLRLHLDHRPRRHADVREPGVKRLLGHDPARVDRPSGCRIDASGRPAHRAPDGSRSSRTSPAAASGTRSGCGTPTARGAGSRPASPTWWTIRPSAGSWATSATSPRSTRSAATPAPGGPRRADRPGQPQPCSPPAVSGALAPAPQRPVAVLLVDLNDFKTLNDTLGHIAGDEMIVAVARRLHAAVPDGATVARLGGDEFAVLVTDGSTGDATRPRRHPRGVRGAGRHLRYRPPISASIGVAVARAGRQRRGLLRRADIAMYAAKAPRRASSRWARYSAELDQPLLDRPSWRRSCARPSTSGQLRLLYQPIVSVADRPRRRVEALLRWRHPERGLLLPAQFVPLAEREQPHPRRSAAGCWPRRAGRRATGTRRYGADAPSVSVNVSARQLHDPTFAEYVAATLARRRPAAPTAHRSRSPRPRRARRSPSTCVRDPARARRARLPRRLRHRPLLAEPAAVAARPTR